MYAYLSGGIRHMFGSEEFQTFNIISEFNSVFQDEDIVEDNVQCSSVEIIRNR